MDVRRILVATDLSDEGLRPYEDVAGLARKLDLDVHLLHVVEELTLAPHGAPLAPTVNVGSMTKEIERARKILEEQAESFSSDVNPTVDVVSSSDVAGAIADYAERQGFQLIALSTHGHSGFRRLVMGSVAEKVLRHAHVPVLVFPRQA